jgi:flagellin-like hook-associated protein FlgL
VAALKMQILQLKLPSLAKSQILQQASTAMLAQANASKQNVLSLLQG